MKDFCELSARRASSSQASTSDRNTGLHAISDAIRRYEKRRLYRPFVPSLRLGVRSPNLIVKEGFVARCSSKQLTQITYSAEVICCFLHALRMRHGYALK